MADPDEALIEAIAEAREAYLSGHGPQPGYEDWRCKRCGGRRWVGWAAGVDMPRRAQCVPCGRVQELPKEVDHGSE